MRLVWPLHRTLEQGEDPWLPGWVRSQDCAGAWLSLALELIPFSEPWFPQGAELVTAPDHTLLHSRKPGLSLLTSGKEVLPY